ncbi:MAG TPA: ATP synthase F0 subunit B [Candidatus Sulfotelmatobacter sp.]|nr:ATP synthase F0 subunit B [Candidatus Sulfotelmatobacter sp.]
MTDLVHQIGELFLRALPVALIVIVFYFILRSFFFKPLLHVMAEREARTLGAQKAAEAVQAAAAERVKQYHDALRQAKAGVYTEQEAERKKLLDERAAFLKDARNKAFAEVNQAKERVWQELETAKREIEGSAVQLATEIARRILPAPAGPGSPAREAR